MTDKSWTIVFDTLCTGFCPVQQDEAPICYDSKTEAQAEIDSDPEFYEDCFVVEESEIGHKTIFYGNV